MKKVMLAVVSVLSLFVTTALFAQEAVTSPADVPAQTDSAPAATEPQAPAAAGYVADRVVATVSGEVITLYEVRRKMRESSDQLSSVMAGGSGREDDAARFQAALDELISDQLIVSEARRMGISISREDVEEHIASIKQRNGWTDDDLASAVRMLGFADLDEYRRQASRELLKSRLLRLKVESRVSVSDTDVQEVFDSRYEGGTTEEEIHLYHIAFVISQDSTSEDISELLKKAIHVRELLVSGQGTFEELAAQYGQDSTSSHGGEVGWFPIGVLQSSLEAAAFGLRDGEYSEVVQSTFGFHLLKVAERRRIPLRNADDARQRVRWELSQAAFQRGYLDFVLELRKAARIEILYVPAP